MYVISGWFSILRIAAEHEQCGLFVAYAAVEQKVSVPEPEVVREITPEFESEPPAEEIHDVSEAPATETEDEAGPAPVENTTAPVIEEPESPMVQSSPAANVHEPELASGEEPKKHSYASIVSARGSIEP